MTPILQTVTPYDVSASRPLPGIAPLGIADWLLVDEAFAPQMAERARLLSGRRDDVLAVTPQAGPAMDELLQFVLDWLASHGRGYDLSAHEVRRPDGERVPLDRGDPMGTLGHLVQEDLCIMEKRGDAHVLTAAVLCFPASWRLSEKIGRPLIAIHDPVPEYRGIAQRVQRLFDGVQPGRPLWRFNAHGYGTPALYHPHREDVDEARRARLPYLRSERQCVLRLPRTRACVFSIHTYIIARPPVTGAAPSAARG